MKLRDVLGVLRDTYCRRVGIEYMHIQDPEERRWIQERIEIKYTKPDPDEQKHILNRLNAAEAFETFLQTKYVGQKRFSLEGGESLIPLLDEVLQASAEGGLDEIVIGMAHRGRLNVLANIVGKPYEKIFNEFEGQMDPKLGARLRRREVPPGPDRQVHHPGRRARPPRSAWWPTRRTWRPSTRCSRASSGPSRTGSTWAWRATRCCRCWCTATPRSPARAWSPRRSTCPSCAATAPAARCTWWSTTRSASPPPRSTAARRSTRTDVARMIQAPIFHVNGDDPEAVVRVARLAFEYRQAFNKDVVIDMVCYRRRGHNEGDDPSMTNPQMYKIIDTKRSVRKLYTEELIGRGDITVEDAEEQLRDYQPQLERVFKATRDAAGTPPPARRHPRPRARSRRSTPPSTPPSSRAVGEAHIDAAGGLHPAQAGPAAARAAGQDVRRGRHRLGLRRDHRVRLAAARRASPSGSPARTRGAARSPRGTPRSSTRSTGDDYLPLAALATGNARFFVHDSLLSEYAAMGFEYGYSVENPDALVALGGPVRRLRQRRPVRSWTSSSPPAR